MEYEGRKFRVIESFTALCCPYKFKVGEILTVYKHSSKNRLYVNAKIGSHNVKRSTLNRCCI